MTCASLVPPACIVNECISVFQNSDQTRHITDTRNRKTAPYKCHYYYVLNQHKFKSEQSPRLILCFLPFPDSPEFLTEAFFRPQMYPWNYSSILRNHLQDNYRSLQLHIRCNLIGYFLFIFKFILMVRIGYAPVFKRHVFCCTYFWSTPL